MKLFSLVAISSILMCCEAIGADRLSENPSDKLTVPIFRETSRDYLSPVFYQQGSMQSQSRPRRQIYNPFSNPYLEEPRGSSPRPWIYFGRDQDAFLRRRHRGGGGFPRRNGNRRPIFVRPFRGGQFAGHRAGIHGARGRGGSRGGVHGGAHGGGGHGGGAPGRGR